MSQLPGIFTLLAKCNLANLRCMQHALFSCSSRATLEADFTGIDQFKLEKDLLFNVLTECRVVIATVQLLPAYAPFTQLALPYTALHTACWCGWFARCPRLVEQFSCFIDHITTCSTYRLNNSFYACFCAATHEELLSICIL